MMRKTLTLTSKSMFYISHHEIWQRLDVNRKLRVVLNASQQSPAEISLNDILHSGPSLQKNLVEVMMRWRFLQVCFTTDVEKMYRQIRVDPSDTDLQRIVWRRPNDDTDTTFRLRTMTYGTRCAPFLAMRTLRQLAEDARSRFSEAAKVFDSSIYVDDILSGADNTNSAMHLQDQLSTLFKSGSFILVED